MTYQTVFASIDSFYLFQDTTTLYFQRLIKINQKDLTRSIGTL